MPTVAQPSARVALDELVHQFADPYAFVRELVQNAIDAGSAEVEVDVRFEPHGDAGGIVTVHVDDWGEGMTREIIEKKLTRLFSSSKDGDRTKIGKFGIGFVSVFSLDPDAVCIDTSRDGQSWRVLFKADRSFELLALPTPVDGTKIRVVKRGTAEFFAEVRARCEASLRHWCRHVEGDIRFAGSSVREPFSLPDAPCAVEWSDGLTRIVVGHRLDGRPFRGFYNSGLTLFESDLPVPGEQLTGPAFKVSSPRLEHTLTRDAVIEDEGYHAVLREVQALARAELASCVFEHVERAAAGAVGVYLVNAARWHIERGVPPDALARVVAFTPAGVPIHAGALRRGTKGNLLLFSAAHAPVTDELEAQGYTVVAGQSDTPHAHLLQALRPGATVVEVATRWCRPILVDPDTLGAAWRGFCEHLGATLRVAGAKLGAVVAARFDYPSSPIADRLAITQAEPGSLATLDELENLRPGLFARRHDLVLNVGHPTVRAFVALAEREPAVAAYFCTKAFRLGRGLDDAMDTKLVEHVVNHRWPMTTR